MARPRLQDVAERAGVSLATASRVLNGSSRQPGPELVTRVRAAADDLGYVVNAQAQALARSRTGLVGLVVQDISDPYFSTIAAGAQVAARQHGFQLVLASTDRDPAVELEAVGALVAHRADAIVVVGTRRGPEDSGLEDALDRYRASGGHAVLVGQPLGDVRTVQPPNAVGAAALAEALLGLGLRRFAVLGLAEPWATPRERGAAFTRAVEAAGGSVETVTASAFSRDGGYDAAEDVAALAASAARPAGERLCVFAVADVMAIGLIAGLRERGVAVPDDVLVAGFDDIPTLRDHVPALTTVRVPLEEMGRRAVLTAVAELDGADDPGLDAPLEAEVALRESTAQGRSGRQ
ncbi:transcriptional regulator, LacI family [Xylanimonas cellulosilytica DSM 15894]|uniref:Transcriptional regulator, LacI family n=1 Tax=Xylanimonas cellulosilytica (strain DSM 15894 / JCM 12276 / CECT 5975 / KCTC 9989 / LMG 20990 / NBRC 107835 / XIL07) TaxID=446471 RepID=D1BY77_XYLCX|nr:LacI family DNA-binding transcriptional regulator [Xylanimonas cellulosilytica]ACZ29920.1 transcriptional regulator, LacI family [Xylanimonas cellulosilytica DSM 15894]